MVFCKWNLNFVAIGKPQCLCEDWQFILYSNVSNIKESSFPKCNRLGEYLADECVEPL